MSKCINGNCEITKNNVCCKKCILLDKCISEWGKDVNGLEHELYFLCTNFDLNNCENEVK